MKQQTDDIRMNENENEIEIDLVELLFYYRSKLLWIVGAFVIGALVAGLITRYAITPKYSATSKLYMVSSSSDSVVDLTDLNIGTSLSSDYEELIKIRPIFEEIIQEKQLEYTYEQLLDMTSIATITDTRILTITVTSTDPEEAMMVTNALADKAVSKLPELMDTSEPNIAEYAILPEHRSSPSYSKNIMIGALGWTVIVLVILTFLYITDDTMKSAEDVEAAFGIMPLTVIPESDIGILSEKSEKEEMKKRRRRRHRYRKQKRKLAKKQK